MGAIGKGLVVLLGVETGDSGTLYMAGKIAKLRIFEDEAGKDRRSLLDVKNEALMISQFTLRRPGAKPARLHPGGGAGASQCPV